MLRPHRAKLRKILYSADRFTADGGMPEEAVRHDLKEIRLYLIREFLLLSQHSLIYLLVRAAVMIVKRNEMMPKGDRDSALLLIIQKCVNYLSAIIRHILFS